jgi:hypothetical protein
LRLSCQGSKLDVTCIADERLFKFPVITSTALSEALGEGCVQDMRKVVHGAEVLKGLAQEYTQVGVKCIINLFFVDTDAIQFPNDYDGREIIRHLSFGNEFAARSWAQVGQGLLCRFW